jgi:predicted GNAT family acetyltransferase
MDLKIEHDKERHQFFVVVENQKCLLDYRALSEGKTLDYRHTFTPPELRGRKIMQAVTHFAMEYAKNNGFKVIPSCPYVRKFVSEHPEYDEIVDGT